ncbi:MAG: apolipoprotein N-acyltransferase [Arcobacteraceae bacterium]|nr:apolipoprotein N-acyltransferase [Arcobacteraceae bacterium]
MNYFSKTNIIKGFLAAFACSIFIYLDFFNINSSILNTFFALFGLYMAIKLDKKSLFFMGFFIGIFWFWWIGLSFRFYDLSYLIPLVVLFFGLFYGVLFFITSYFDRFYARFIALFLLSSFEPFGFNWFKLEIIFINSYINSSKISLFLVLALFTLLLALRKKIGFFKLSPLLLIFLLIFNYPKEPKTLANINVKLTSMNIPQDLKWQQLYKNTLIEENLKEISNAIDEGYDLVVLPEATFALALNKSPILLDKLQTLSQDIDIIAGGIFYDGENYNNSTYYFSKRDMQIANKMVLVPFGEASPLPPKMAQWINDIFYDGAKDFIAASSPSDFEIKGYKFRNAICYEATSKELFMDNPDYMIAISNNAWFTPSIEPTLQKLLMKHYAKKHNTIIYSVTNGSQSMIITP